MYTDASNPGVLLIFLVSSLYVIIMYRDDHFAEDCGLIENVFFEDSFILLKFINLPSGHFKCV